MIAAPSDLAIAFIAGLGLTLATASFALKWLDAQKRRRERERRWRAYRR